eukprot:TRINITY_DN3593_c0_g1_i4.p1 TRINITY_DN3593_c0_g1~~TRINITY_DN3593_c0_g1_i4.p1  ORF type:complete len:384 (+),score=90.75 TRINITY_DN3593_c0_g1_i4:3338-4489(+)
MINDSVSCYIVIPTIETMSSSSLASIVAPNNSSGISLTIIIAIIVAGTVLLVIIILLIIVLLRRRRAAKNTHTNSFSMIDLSNIPLGQAKNALINFDELQNFNVIGSGGYGVVSKANWRGMEVAVKQIKSENVNEQELRDFLHEVALIQGLGSHPNVVLFMGITFPPQPLSMVLEFCEGGSLHSYVRNNQVSMEQQMTFVRGIAKGMLHLHKEKIIHRDLAARNILLSKHLEVKVADFGLSRQQNNEIETTKSNIGPIRWMAPEAINRRQYSSMSDAFSFGICIWEILVGKDPHEEMSLIEVAIAVTTRGLRPTIPPGTDQVLSKLMTTCWATVPEERPDFEEICCLFEDQTLEKVEAFGKREEKPDGAEGTNYAALLLEENE